MRRSGSGPPRSEGRTTRRTRTCSTSRRPCIGLRNPTKANGECGALAPALNFEFGWVSCSHRLSLPRRTHAPRLLAGRAVPRRDLGVDSPPAPAVLADCDGAGKM